MTDGGGIFFARQQPGWRFQLLRLGLLFFLLVFAVGWAVGAVFRGARSPAARQPPHGGCRFGSVAPVLGIRPSSGAFFVGCFAVAWFAGLAAVVSQGDVGGSLLGLAFTAFFLLGAVNAALHRQHVSVDPLVLQICDSWGRLTRTHRYELRLIHDPRVERLKDEDGDPSRYWRVAFQYGSKTVRFGKELSQTEAMKQARELAEQI